jgi:hypothetical protein
MSGISKSQVRAGSARSWTPRGRTLQRPPAGRVLSLRVAGRQLPHKARQDGQVVSVAIVIAMGVKAGSGEREVLGLDVGPSEDGSFWLSFLRSLVARGLSGVRLVTSDADQGLKGAIGAVLQGASWQRCREHFMRNALSSVPKAAQQMVGATIRTVFAQSPTHKAPTSSGGGLPRGSGAVSRSWRNSWTKRKRGRSLLRGFPCRALAKDLVEQPTGEAKQGDQA